ncbi:hypothetical protein DPEC_G00270180 [Dallia pectoralis]|uniref:Uncharacterized protein n=1 Tax=Dallia pectoralis TaxID=75939 RepID=A0ACC2FP78_DALPE|nr:hypothetical protein DPEC_G00270180 [Dallia pectoralis]
MDVSSAGLSQATAPRRLSTLNGTMALSCSGDDVALWHLARLDAIWQAFPRVCRPLWREQDS